MAHMETDYNYSNCTSVVSNYLFNILSHSLMWSKFKRSLFSAQFVSDFVSVYRITDRIFVYESWDLETSQLNMLCLKQMVWMCTVSQNVWHIIIFHFISQHVSQYNALLMNQNIHTSTLLRYLIYKRDFLSDWFLTVVYNTTAVQMRLFQKSPPILTM